MNTWTKTFLAYVAIGIAAIPFGILFALCDYGLVQLFIVVAGFFVAKYTWKEIKFWLN